MTIKQKQNYMDIAILRANLSYCEKRKVGAIIVKNNDIIATGYNGTITGTDNNCEHTYMACPNCGSDIYKNNIDVSTMYNYKLRHICEKCKTIINMDLDWYENLDNFKMKTKLTVVHAEQNAITNAAKNGVSLMDTTIFVTTLPCIKCATLIAQSGIKEVYYLDEYKNNESLHIFKEVNILVQQL